MAQSIKTSDGSAPLRTVGIQVDLRRLGTRNGSRTRTSASSASRRWTCPECSRTVRGEVIATVAVVPSARGDPARKPAQRATFGDYLSAERERLGGGESLSSEAIVVEDASSAKTEDHDRLKVLDASIANLEKARGGKPDVAIDEVLRQKRLERQELKDQMQSGDRGKVAETTGDFGRKERSPREGARGRNSSSASCSAPPSPQQWALGLAASLPEDVRVKFEEWYNGVEIEAKASVDPYLEVLSQGSPATSLPADPVSSTPIEAKSTGPPSVRRRLLSPPSVLRRVLRGFR